MANSRADVRRTIEAFLLRANKSTQGLTDDRPLYADGIGLDSLETAELSATLEDEHGADPYGSGSMPQTIGELLDFYDGVSAGV